MYMQNYDDFVKNEPDSPWKRCVVRILSTPRPDLTELEKEVAAFKRQLNEEYLAGERAKREAAEVAR